MGNAVYGSSVERLPQLLQLWLRSVVIAILILAGILSFTAPVLAAPHVVFDAETLDVYSEEAPHQRWAPASITKLMTTYVALKAVKAGKLTLASPVRISAAANANPPSKMNFPVGTILRLDMALAIIMVKSANDVSHAIAESIGGSSDRFAQIMNAEAAKLGMVNTHFMNANGLPNPAQYTSAHDMGLLAAALINDFQQYSAFFKISSIEYNKSHIRNHNGFLKNYLGADGMKTGYICASGFNLVASAKRKGQHLVLVILGEPSAKLRDAEAARLMTKAFETAGNRMAARNLLKLTELRQSIWAMPQPVDISGAMCAKGGRDRWRKNLPEYVKALQSRYYSANTLSAPVLIRLGGANGPGGINLAAGNDNSAALSASASSEAIAASANAVPAASGNCVDAGAASNNSQTIDGEGKPQTNCLPLPLPRADDSQMTASGKAQKKKQNKRVVEGQN